jgi:hypothetical protein
MLLDIGKIGDYSKTEAKGLWLRMCGATTTPFPRIDPVLISHKPPHTGILL